MLSILTNAQQACSIEPWTRKTLPEMHSEVSGWKRVSMLLQEARWANREDWCLTS